MWQGPYAAPSHAGQKEGVRLTHLYFILSCGVTDPSWRLSSNHLLPSGCPWGWFPTRKFRGTHWNLSSFLLSARHSRVHTLPEFTHSFRSEQPRPSDSELALGLLCLPCLAPRRRSMSLCQTQRNHETQGPKDPALPSPAHLL